MTKRGSWPGAFGIHYRVQTVHDLNAAFAIPDCLSFDEPTPGMPRARIETPACTAELYLQGAHLTQWQPTGMAPVLYLSPRSTFAPGKAIRGGIPVIFPWFGAATTSPVATPEGAGSHGYARTSPWSLRFAGLAGDDLHLSLTLDPQPEKSSDPLHGLQLALEIAVGRTLTLRLVVARPAASASTGSAADPVLVEEALHAYLHLGELEQVTIEGLEGLEYLDKTDHFARKREPGKPFHFAGETDRPYLHAPGPVTLVDPVLRRRIVVTKRGSESTVVWNPAAELTAKLPDLAPDAFEHFACIEAANVADDALSLAPGQAHTLRVQYTVEAM